MALVFGRERTGLTNEELQQCHYHVNIPANPEYSSLNVAMAVQTLSYEIRMAWLAQQETGVQVDDDSDYPPQASMELFSSIWKKHYTDSISAFRSFRARHDAITPHVYPHATGQ